MVRLAFLRPSVPESASVVAYSSAVAAIAVPSSSITTFGNKCSVAVRGFVVAVDLLNAPT